MEKVLGIGGLFFRSQNPKELSLWYQKHLGINLVPEGPEETPWIQEKGVTAFAPFSIDTDYFKKQHQWMINFRVRNLDAMIVQLEKSNISVKRTYADDSIGYFAQLEDPEGNPIELWEPI